jgi:hypothetical protein
MAKMYGVVFMTIVCENARTMISLQETYLLDEVRRCPATIGNCNGFQLLAVISARELSNDHMAFLPPVFSQLVS